MKPGVLDPEIGGEIDDEAGAAFEHLRRELRRLPVLEAEEDHVATGGRLGRRFAAEARLGETGELGVNVAHRLARLAPAGGDPLPHFGMDVLSSRSSSPPT